MLIFENIFDFKNTYKNTAIKLKIKSKQNPKYIYFKRIFFEYILFLPPTLITRFKIISRIPKHITYKTYYIYNFHNPLTIP